MTRPTTFLRPLAAAFLATMLLTGTALADPGGHDADDAPYGMMGPGYGMGQGYGMGPGMMGPGYGAGPGYGMGPGMMGPGYGRGYGYGMMGPGYGRGYGMMGPGYGMGPGMMGPGYGQGYGYGMGPGMMGPGYGMGQGYGYCPYCAGTPNRAEPLSTDDVKAMMERRLELAGNPHVKLGKVEAKGDNTVEVEIVTADGGALVDKLAVDRNTGRITRMR